MQTFAQWFFLTFGLRRRMNVRRTPSALQVDRSNIVPLRPNHRGPQRPCPFRIGIEIRGQGERYIRPIAAQSRTV